MDDGHFRLLSMKSRCCLPPILAAGLLGPPALLAPGFGQDAAPTVAPARGGTRGPFEVAFTPDGRKALVTEFDEGTLAVVDVAEGRVLARHATGGREPTGVAVTLDGAHALVTNSYEGSLAFIDLATGKRETLALPGAPYDVVVSPDGRMAYVSVSQFDRVVSVDLATKKPVAEVPTGRRPRALSLTPDGRVLVSANLTAGSVTFIDAAGMQVIGHGRTPAVNVRGVAVFPDGRQAYIAAQRAQNERPTETPVGIWSNQSFRQVPNGPQNTVENVWLDFIGQEVSDPDSVVLSPRGDRVYMTCSGGHSVQVMASRGATEAKSILGVGAVPRGLALSPDGRELWVCCQLGNDVAVIGLDTLTVTRRVNLGPPGRKDPTHLGRFLFHTASITKGRQFSCNSCHPDGNTDGISWKFVHVPDALGKEITRNVRSLRGEIEDTAPFRWTGRETRLAEFVDDELAGLLQSPEVSQESRQALVAYVRGLRLPPNPYRNPDGSFTDTARRGEQLFNGKAECRQCHTGPKHGGERKAWVGTTKQGVDLDVPHLIGVYDSDPYLHTGEARTLEEVFSRFNGAQAHGKAHELTADELRDLLRYVREL